MHLGYFSRLVAIVLAASLAACAHLPLAVSAGCRLPAYRLVVNRDGLGTGERALRSTDEQEFQSMVNGALGNAHAHALLGGSADVLILSGGSQHGAFGAGYFAGIGPKKPGPSSGGVPNYVFVTGVSAGALVSTLVFLANEPIEGGRKYPQYMQGTGVSNLEDNASIFAVDEERRIIHPWSGGVLEGVAKGSLATFSPLRSLIFGMLSDATLFDIQKAHKAGRHLLIGVTNLETGDGYAIDLTQYVDDAIGRGVATDAVRTCYIDALLASSSVPPGMPPVSLSLVKPITGEPIGEPSLYIDGGARFGVFWGQIDNKKLPNLKTASMLINGTFSAGSWEEFQKKGKWTILSVAKRSSEILVNQVYRFSVDQIEHQFPSSVQLSEAYISNKDLLKRYGSTEVAIDPDLFVHKIGKYESTCGGWRKYDDDNLHPLEFHPDYMQCLVAYGRMRGSRAPWNKVTP